MTLEQLRIFVAVAERQHLTKAAQALNLTQSAVSSAVTAHERRHGVVLFDRVGRGLVLNEAGRVFLEEARGVLARAAAAETALDDLAGLARGRLSIHASETVAGYWLPPRLVAFHDAHPGILLEIGIDNTAGVARAVVSGAAELGVVEGELDDPVLNRTVIGHDRLSLVVKGDHPWVISPPRTPAQLRESRWILREPGSGTRSSFEAALARSGSGVGDLDVAMVLPGNEAVRAAVEAGGGAAVMSRSVAASGLATIINGFLLFGVARWGHAAVDIAQALWWLDAALAVVCGVAIPFMMFTRQSHSIDQMTAIWLLPVVAAEVAAVSGGLLAPHLADVHQQLSVLVSSYALWACSVPLAMSILVILVLRMAIHKLPHAGMAASSWLALGPIGTGALGLLVLGAAAPAIFAANGLGVYGDAARGIGLIGGLLLWAYGLWWMALGVLITLRYLRDGLPFNLGWWGYTFPIGVYAVATLRLSTLLPIPPFAVFGGALVVALAILWLIVGARTVRGAWHGDLFVAPCLQEGRGGCARADEAHDLLALAAPPL